MRKHPTELLGAHALGALEPGEAAAVEGHLRSCATCREELRSLAAIPALLDLTRLETTSAPLAVAPSTLEDRVLAGLDAPPHRRRRGPWRALRSAWLPGLGGAAAGAAATVAVLAAAGALGGSSAAPSRTVSLTGPAGAATAVLRAQDGGTRIDLQVDALPDTTGREVYEVWFVNAGGRVSAGTFTTGQADGRVRVALNTAAAPGGYDRIGVTREPDGLDPARNGPNILAAPLPE